MNFLKDRRGVTSHDALHANENSLLNVPCVPQHEAQIVASCCFYAHFALEMIQRCQTMPINMYYQTFEINEALHYGALGWSHTWV